MHYYAALGALTAPENPSKKVTIMARSRFEASPSEEAASFWDRLTAYVPQSEFYGNSQPAEQDNLEFARKAEHLDARRQQDLLIASIGMAGFGGR